MKTNRIAFNRHLFMPCSLKITLRVLAACTSMFILQPRCQAQDARGNDTSYYKFFPNSITGRLYVSQKYTDFTIKSNNAKDLRYLPNTTFNLGIGATYHNFSLNLAYGFGFLNKNADKGHTRYLDLQSHFYTTKWATDFYGQLYKGYHLAQQGFNALPGNYYYRHDISVALFGISEYRVLNYRRFSYRAAFIQNEWQKKSAGTILFGAEVYYGVVHADSSFVPKSIETAYSESGINKINYVSIGPGVGYAYTLVLLHHLFITGSLTGNLNFSYATLQGAGTNNHFGVNAVTRFRVAAGYNGAVWNVSANWIADNLPFTGSNSENKFAFSTGNYRFIIARRFYAGKRLQKRLRILDSIFKD